ncbi:unnamed protein product [Moneuplotes crassus]|uniref:Uncharacterized protein n=1 Tax=Euplotes crassus TaxID=5936 RepID=A0AAD1TZ85_EUPCR|nr:unnamed protein product [Moneuplotes crassus]
MSQQSSEDSKLAIEERSKKLEDSKSELNTSNLGRKSGLALNSINQNISQKNIAIEGLDKNSNDGKLSNAIESNSVPAKRELLKKLAEVCGITFYCNISTIEFDLEEHAKEILNDTTKESHDIQIRDDGQRAGEEITLYDSLNKTMYHTVFSRLSRKEIESMLGLVKKSHSNGKYRKMRILPHSIKQIQEALEKAHNGKELSQSQTDQNDYCQKRSQEFSESDSNTRSPYGKLLRNLQQSQGLNLSLKDKYFTKATDSSRGEESHGNNELKRIKKKQQKMRKQYQEAQRINDIKLQQFMKRQREIKSRNDTSSQISSLKDQISAAITRSNERKKQGIHQDIDSKKIMQNIHTNISFPSIKKLPKSRNKGAAGGFKMRSMKIRLTANKSASPSKNTPVGQGDFTRLRYKLSKKKRKINKDLSSQMSYSRNSFDQRRKLQKSHTPNIYVENAYIAQKSMENIKSGKVSRRIMNNPVLTRSHTNEKPPRATKFNSYRDVEHLGRSLKRDSGYNKFLKRLSNRRVKPTKTSVQTSASKRSLHVKNNGIDTCDYLLQRRIEREIKPTSRWKLRNKCLRECGKNFDFYKIHHKAKEVTRKALLIEERILENQSEQEKMKQTHEVDTMLIDSLKAKIALLNNLSSKHPP